MYLRKESLLPKQLKLAAAALAFAAPLFTVSFAHAQPVETQNQNFDGGPEIIKGGTTQSTDPTAYNYVSEESEPDTGIQPLSASGYEPINGFIFTFRGVDYKVATGELQHRIIGSGNYIETEGSQYRVPSTICNWRVDYQNRNGAQIHTTFVGQTHVGCSFGAVADTGPTNVYVKSGSQQCARLYIGDHFRGEQCHNIG